MVDYHIERKQIQVDSNTRERFKIQKKQKQEIESEYVEPACMFNLSLLAPPMPCHAFCTLEPKNIYEVLY